MKSLPAKYWNQRYRQKKQSEVTPVTATNVTPAVNSGGKENACMLCKWNRQLLLTARFQRVVNYSFKNCTINKYEIPLTLHHENRLDKSHQLQLQKVTKQSLSVHWFAQGRRSYRYRSKDQQNINETSTNFTFKKSLKSYKITQSKISNMMVAGDTRGNRLCRGANIRV